MGHPEMMKELMKEDLPPLIPPEGLEHLRNKYVQSVQVTWSIIHGWNDWAEYVCEGACPPEKTTSYWCFQNDL